MSIYLYVKRHTITGLKYFGKTIQNPYTYNGSGKLWTKHIAKHGRQYIETLNVWAFKDQDSCSKFALTFSSQNNIVESDQWANLVVEDGINVPPSFKGKKRRPESVEKSRQARLGKKRSYETRLKMSKIAMGKKRGPCTDSRRSNISKARLGKKWFMNQDKTDCVCCYPGSEPPGWIPGMIKNSKEATEQSSSDS
jgi:hypothetical protein